MARLTRSRRALVMAGVIALGVAAPAKADLIAAYDRLVPGNGYDIAMVNLSTLQPITVPAGVNTTADEFHPSLTGDGRLLTVFTNESRQDAGRHAPREIGCVEHIAFNVSRATFALAPARLRAHGIEFIQRDRGFMDSIYLHDPNGLKIELACYKFETPEGFRAADVLTKAFALRLERGDHHITEEHVADAIELLLATRHSRPLPEAAAAT